VPTVIRLQRLLPKSLVGRVFALYSFALVSCVLLGIGLFYRYQFSRQLENAHADAETLLSVLAPAVSDNAVIGDYDAIQHLLDRAVRHTNFEEVSYHDALGGTLRASDPPMSGSDVPAWFERAVRSQLLDVDRPLNVGGKDYGHLQMIFSSAAISAGLWHLAGYVAMLAAVGLLGGLLLIRQPLQRWLGNLDRMQRFEAEIRAGGFDAARVLAPDAPLEFRQTFAMLTRAAAQVQAQREQASTTLEAISDAVLTTDETGRVRFANEAAHQLLGHASGSLSGQLVQALLPGVADLGQQDPSWAHRRIEFTRTDGQALVLDTTRSPLSLGDTDGHVLACRDVTEQHRLDLALQAEHRSRTIALAALRRALEGASLLPSPPSPPESTRPAGPTGDIEAVSQMVSRLVSHLQERTEQLDAIFELSPDGFVSFDADHRVTYASAAFSQLTGLSSSMVVGLEEDVFVFRLASRCDREAVAAIRSLQDAPSTRSGAAGGGRRVLIELKRPAQRTLELGLSNSASRAVSQVLHLRDVTREKEVEQMKSDFLTLAAHELRTPMSSIYGFAEILSTRELAPARRKDVVDRIYRQSEVMISILNELLDLSRIEARRGKDFVIEPIDAAELLTSALEEFQPPADRAPPQLELPAASVPLRVDRQKIQQALRNLLSNAYKYSPGGGTVRVTMRLRPAGRNQATEQPAVGLVVEDQGIGLSPEQLARVGERFYRADKSGNIPGTGLGVSIVREVVELHGGSMQVQSAIGKGTRFTLWLPAAMTGTPAELAAPADTRPAFL